MNQIREAWVKPEVGNGKLICKNYLLHLFYIVLLTLILWCYWKSVCFSLSIMHLWISNFTENLLTNCFICLQVLSEFQINELITYVYTYVIGHYDLASYVVYMNFRYEWWQLQVKVDTLRILLRILLRWWTVYMK